MGTFLFESTVFGPIQSRRLGISLGINLLPLDGKVCSFNCLYCECGLNEQRRSKKAQLPSLDQVSEALEERLTQMSADGDALDVITFAGNGEPTIHPNFLSIIQRTVELRDRLYPDVEISVLANSAHLDRPPVLEALTLIDNTILKLDAAINDTFQIINQPNSHIVVEDIIQYLINFEGKKIIQTLFCYGESNGVAFDNTSEKEVQALIDAYFRIKPERIMIYSLSRDTPIETIYQVEKERLDQIAQRLRAEGFNVEVA